MPLDGVLGVDMADGGALLVAVMSMLPKSLVLLLESGSLGIGLLLLKLAGGSSLELTWSRLGLMGLSMRLSWDLLTG